MGVQGITEDSRDGEYLDASGGRSCVVPPRPEQEAHNGKTKDRVVNKALALHFLASVWHRCS